jgi:hypothetical protein
LRAWAAAGSLFEASLHPTCLWLCIALGTVAAEVGPSQDGVAAVQEQSQGDDREPVQCGEPFVLRIEAVDAYGNK